MWTEANKRCIWFKVNIKDAAWVPVLANVILFFFILFIFFYLALIVYTSNFVSFFIQEGFNFHHARDDFVMMYKWLPDTPSNLPPACHTNLGVGGMVFNDKNEILVVTENYIEFPHWKLPGGYVERGYKTCLKSIIFSFNFFKRAVFNFLYIYRRRYKRCSHKRS